MSNGKVLLGLLAGIAAGATLGILFAPEKGSKTRKKIYKQGDDYSTELGEKFKAFIDIVTKKVEALQVEASNMIEKGKTQAKDVVAEAHTVANNKIQELK